MGKILYCIHSFSNVGTLIYKKQNIKNIIDKSFHVTLKYYSRSENQRI